MGFAVPIYEYECRKCGYRFEVIQEFSDRPITRCQRDGCRGRVQKLMSPAAVIYKGSGFHTTDYCRKGRSDGDGDGAKAKSDVESKVKETAGKE